MRILRVYVSDSSGGAPVEWALFDDDRVVAHGSGERPPADRVEAVVGADAARVLSLALPPMPRSRVASAVSYALEDRVALLDDVVVGSGAQREDGSVLAALASRDTVVPLADALPSLARAIAEAELAAPVDGWRWCEGPHAAFVRVEDGTAFAVSRLREDALPAELAHALSQAAREGRAPARVVVDRTTDDETLAGWTRGTGVAFVAGTPWRWQDAPAAAFAGAIDLMQGLRRDDARPIEALRWTVPLALLGAALAVHVVATLATWGFTHVRLANAQRDLVPLAQAAGAASSTPRTAAADILRQHALARQRAGLQARDDAMPVLARAAPALAALPAGALKTATWNAGAWTLDLAPLDEALLADFTARLSASGLTPMHARTAAGVRARISP